MSTTEEDKPVPAHLLMPPTPVLETARLILRPPQEKDIAVSQRKFPQWKVVRYLHAEVPWPYPADGAEQHRARMTRELERREKSHWTITLRGGDDALIGHISLWKDDSFHDQRGFWLDPEYWGEGLMTEAADRVTDYALIELGWPHLWLSNAEINTASHRVKEKQGALIVERSPRKYVYGDGIKVSWILTRDAWLKHRGVPEPRPA